MQDHTVLQDRLRRILGDLTFAEAYQRSGACWPGFLPALLLLPRSKGRSGAW